jgi:GT2 family glycosyltransferase
MQSDRQIADGAIEAVVVDNRSNPHPLLRRLRRWPDVSLRRWRRNQGFARAVNEGCRLSQADWFLVLNPDVTLSPDFVRDALAIIERLNEEHPRVGIVGVALQNSDGQRQLSTGPFPSLLNTVLRLALPRARRKYSPARMRKRRRVPWVTGCCFLMRRACWRELGGLDPDYFLYYEEVDLCLRARQLGWTILFEPALQAVHHRPLQNRSISPRQRLITRHALVTYASKHWPRWQFQMLCGLVRLESWCKRRWARLRKDEDGAAAFKVLGKVVEDIRHGRRTLARTRLMAVVSNR